jgi:hypothetical protein
MRDKYKGSVGLDAVLAWTRFRCVVGGKASSRALPRERERERERERRIRGVPRPILEMQACCRFTARLVGRWLRIASAPSLHDELSTRGAALGAQNTCQLGSTKWVGYSVQLTQKVFSVS